MGIGRDGGSAAGVAERAAAAAPEPEVRPLLLLAEGAACKAVSATSAGSGRLGRRPVRIVGAAALLAAAGALALAATGRAASGTPAAREPAGAEARGELTEVQLLVEAKKQKECSDMNQNCNETKCCKVSGTQCYRKDKEWALCRPNCFPGPDPVDMDNKPWACEALGERTRGHYKPTSWPAAAPWVQTSCSGAGENCTESRCCKAAGNVCWSKDSKWASCKAECVEGPDPTDSDSNPWSCKRLGMRTPGVPAFPTAPAKWVATNCSKGDEDCSNTGCCADAGMQCFRKNKDIAKCLVGCLPGVHMDDTDDHPWNCTPLGARTPGMAAVQVRKPGKWVKEKCSKANKNCHETRCCQEEGTQCYEANEKYASCLVSCTEWKTWEVNSKLINKATNKTWSCKKLGPRTPREWQSPSLFCFSVFRLYTAEADLMRNQLWKGIGIFACDLYGVFSSDQGADLGDGPLGELKTVHFDAAPVWRSKDGTAANTQLFMNVWEAVRWDGRYSKTDWTIKADPDAVVVPERIRWKLKVHSGHAAFILTCGKAGMPDGPMMFGSVEAISVQALWAYFASETTCRNLPWQSWGEDLWMGNCLKNLGASAEADFGMVSDGVCLYANCNDKNAAAFHPFKDVHSWLACYWTSQR
mmetsp:Transcript_97860/g.272362  ORF Transcript_97860/g.272362 Transcript_97860/m.272362 type:complete len:641 (-) Transcript_97860:55-1977(-)